MWIHLTYRTCIWMIPTPITSSEYDHLITGTSGKFAHKGSLIPFFFRLSRKRNIHFKRNNTKLVREKKCRFIFMRTKFLINIYKKILFNEQEKKILLNIEKKIFSNVRKEKILINICK